MSQPGTQRSSGQQSPLNPPHYASQEDNLFGGDGTLPPGYDSFASSSAPFDPNQFADIKQEGYGSQSHSPQQPQFTDYTLYGGDQGFREFDDKGLQGEGINPADLSLMTNMNSDPSSHHSTPSMHLQSPQEQQPGSATFMSTGSTNAAFEWDNIFQHNENSNTWEQHRRAPSEYSEISSAAQSPFLANQEFQDQPSPLLQGQGQQGPMTALLGTDAPSPGDDYGFSNFSLNDHSPRVSPQPGFQSEHTSPYLGAQDNNFLGMVPGRDLNAMPPPPPRHGAGLGLQDPNDDSCVPQINFIFSPPQRQPTFPHSKPGIDLDDTQLIPPPKSPQRRQRSKSDPYTGGAGQPGLSRPSSGSSTPEGGRSRRNSLSPIDIVTAPVGSPRSGSPARASHAGKGHNRRSSTNSLPNRDYILELAAPNRTGPGGDDQKRKVQKHPATFHCHLCPKKFTRAYNLRSHLRTHTDERPFVCTVCSKAFARQHDRKRHESLHSGEKKFVCSGQLKNGGTWGCKRRFARADALGRHFRSEAGRVCIRPLLDEEAAERQRNAMMASGQMLDPTMGSMQPPPPEVTLGSNVAQGGQKPVSLFPVALLEQFPALANMEWSVLENGGGGGGGGEEFGVDEWEESASGGSHRNSWSGNVSDGGWGSDNGVR